MGDAPQISGCLANRGRMAGTRPLEAAAGQWSIGEEANGTEVVVAGPEKPLSLGWRDTERE
jgi:hypothetical protein